MVREFSGLDSTQSCFWRPVAFISRYSAQQEESQQQPTKNQPEEKRKNINNYNNYNKGLKKRQRRPHKGNFHLQTLASVVSSCFAFKMDATYWESDLANSLLAIEGVLLSVKRRLGIAIKKASQTARVQNFLEAKKEYKREISIPLCLTKAPFGEYVFCF